MLKAGLTDRNESADTVEYLHAAEWPEGVEVLVGGTPAIEQDSIGALLETLPLMVVVVVLLTTLLMFLAFGSLVLPVKAVLMSAWVSARRWASSPGSSSTATAPTCSTSPRGRSCRRCSC